MGILSNKAVNQLKPVVADYYRTGPTLTRLKGAAAPRQQSRSAIVRYTLNTGTFSAGTTTTVGMTTELIDTHNKATVSSDEITVTAPLNYAYVVCQYSMKNNTGTPSEDVLATVKIECRLAPLGSWVAFHSVPGICWQTPVALHQFNGSVIPNAECDGFRVRVVNSGASDTIGGGSGSLHVIYF